MAISQVGPHNNAPRARENYDLLLQFARRIRANHPNNAVRVVDRGAMGLGLQAVRDIHPGEIVVWYGGPYVALVGIAERYRTHSVHVFDHSAGVNQIPRAIDGKIMSTAFRDASVTQAERDEFTTIAGPLVNSTITNVYNEDGTEETTEVAPMMAWAADGQLTTWTHQGVTFAAKPLVATRLIHSGEDVLWRYFYYDQDGVDDLSFPDMIRPPPPPAKPKKRIAPISGGGGSKAAKTSASRQGLVSLARLRL